MSRDNFKDEFEKSKQKIERESNELSDQDQTVNNETDNIDRDEHAQINHNDSNEIFPPRGASRRNRSQERKNREKSIQPDEKVTYDAQTNKGTVENQEETVKENKKRDRSIIASATGVGGSVVGNVASNKNGIHGSKKSEVGHSVDNSAQNESKNNGKKKAAAGAAVAGTGAAASASRINDLDAHKSEDKKDNDGNGMKKFLPFLAAILLLIPIIILLSNFINNQDDGKPKTEEVVVNKEKDENNKAATTKSADKSTEEKATEEKATEEVNKTTEEATTEAAVAENDNTSDTTTNSNNTVPAANSNSTTANTNNAGNTSTANSTVTNGGTSHVVGAKENLYRIAIKYYGSGSPENVDKIRRANGISGNNLSAGQTLVIPE